MSRKKFRRSHCSNCSVILFITVVAGSLLTVESVRGQSPVVRRAAQVHHDDRINLDHVVPITRGRKTDRVGERLRQQPPVETVSHLEPVAMYDGGVFESTCGCETVCDCPIGGYGDATCGLEAAFPMEPTCGCEGIGCDACCDGMNAACGCNACVGGLRSFLDGFFPRLRIQWNRFDLFAGVVGHTGPLNFANVAETGTSPRGTGSFGFYEGFNKGMALDFFGADLSYQSGVRFTQGNLSGAGFNDESRGQVFVTSGVFRRVDSGLQFGLVLDYLYEDWYYSGNLMQLRGELSYVFQHSHVWGLKYATGVRDDSALTSVVNDAGVVVRNNLDFESLNQYRLFYRNRLGNCGLLEGFIGWTDTEDGILGLDLDIPLTGHLAWNTSATYLIPDEGAGNLGNQEETWNLGIGFTYRPGGLRSGSRYDRPMFKVADNGTLLVGRR